MVDQCETHPPPNESRGAITPDPKPFTPETLGRTARQAGGRVVWCWHQAKPRYYLWSLGLWLRDRGAPALARACEWRPLYGVLKLGLELTLPLARWARRGEVIRIGIERAAQ